MNIDPGREGSVIRSMTAAEGDSFHELYVRHAPSVYATAMAILKDAETAHDVTHDVFIRAWRQAAQFDSSRGSLGVWLRAVARNLSIDRLRSAQRLRTHEAILDNTVTPNGSLSDLLIREQMEALRRAFYRLPALHRELIEMAYDRELSHSDIARRLGQPLGTVKSRIRQALAMLRTFAAEVAPDSNPNAPSWLIPSSQAFTTVDAEAETIGDKGRPAHRLTVLVVDDDRETVKLVSAVLRKFHVDAEARTSAREGLRALEKAWPDVVISDLNMPDEDGYSMIGKARLIATEKGKRLRAAAFTSWASEQERSRALIAGFDLYINKPIHPLALMSAVIALSQ